jgi:hypothetical protein
MSHRLVRKPTPRLRRLSTLAFGTLFSILVAPAADAEGRNDVLVALDTSNAFIFLDIDDFGADMGLTRGTLSMETEDANCVASPSTPCSYVINYLRFEFSSFTQPTTVGDFTLTNPFVVVQGPIAVEDTGFGLVIPTGQSSQFGGVASGPGIVSGFRRDIQSLPQPMTINLDVANQGFSIEGEFSGTLEGHSATGILLSTGTSPFVNLPPVAEAGPDRTLSCPGQLTLDGSGSSDPNDSIELYRWTLDGVPLTSHSAAFGATTSVSLPEGEFELGLEVLDTFGSRAVDSAFISVNETAPTFTFVPPPVSKIGCGAVSIGQATAASPCGPATVTNDAPSSFPVGVTIVTWTASRTTPEGDTLQAVAQQTVTVLLGDNSACCPAGYHVIKGTSNNNTLNGTSGNDCILGLGAQDTINGNGGNDIISGGDGDDVITGGAGDDMITGGTGQDRITDSSGNDTLSGGDGDDRVEGGPGNDVLFGGQGQDRLICGDGNDSAFGEDGSDTLEGGIGNDALDGGPGTDSCAGGGGSDTFVSCQTIL